MQGSGDSFENREPKTLQELQIIVAETISDMPGSVFVPPDLIGIGPDDNAEGSWWYGYDHDSKFSQIVKQKKNIVDLRKIQGKFRLVP